MCNTKKILKKNGRVAIWNRGESAMRFIRAVKDYNFLYGAQLTTVAFHIPVEESALFVKEADEAYSLKEFQKPDKTISPYLDFDAALEALRQTKCDALWPGWGFLAEDDKFVSLLEKENIVFLGPCAKAMALLGDKIQAKKLAEETGVPILPWSKKSIANLEEAKEYAKQIGYPVILKAANAGGGRGIRMVKTEKDLPQQFESAREETIRITTNDSLFMERLVEKSRHLEVQVVADDYGNVFTFGVRDCSVQRKNQKIIEETPPPNFPADKIECIQKDASKLMLAANYTSAGTVEFIYDVVREEYYFMEVNTRLQVEHPITEQIYQIDLVQAQINVASGKKLEIDAHPRGHTLEVRLNAEDPEKGFIPAPGVISVFTPPAGSGIRVDSGVEQGSEIPTDFDSMIAKIISSGSSREEAIAKLKRALGEMHIKIEGGITNRAFLLELLNCKEVREGNVDTKFVERFLENKKRNKGKQHWHIALISCAIEKYLAEYQEELQNFKQQYARTGYLHNVPMPITKKFELQLEGNSYPFLVRSVGGNIFHVEINKELIVVTFLPRGEQRLVIYEGKRFIIQQVERGDTIVCEVDGIPHPIEMDSGGIIKAPAPSIVLSLIKEVGQTVAKGDVILTLEAMKMETAVFATEDGIIKELYVKKGEQVAAGQLLVALDAKGETVVKEKGEPVDFAVLTKGKKYKNQLQQKWEILEQQFLAVFLGYDIPQKMDVWENLMQFAIENDSYQKHIYPILLKSIEIFVSVERLFSKARFKAEDSEQTLNSQELLAHYFKRTGDREKGLPKEFVSRLKEAIGWYNYRSLNKEETTNRVVFRIYKAHANCRTSTKVLRTALFSSKDILFSAQNYNRQDLGKVLDRLIKVAQMSYPDVVDAAFHARYHLIDLPQLNDIRQKNREDLLKTFDVICNNKKNAQKYEDLATNIINSGNYINFDLIEWACGKEIESRKMAIELLARRFNRYRKFHKSEILEIGKEIFCHVQYVEKKKTKHFICTVTRTDKFKEHLQSVYSYLDDKKLEAPEIMFFCSSTKTRNAEEESNFIENIPDYTGSINLFYLGFFYKSEFYYHTLRQIETKWVQDKQRSNFSPLVHNELRVDKLSNFDLELLNRTRTVYLLKGTAHSNPRDQRLFVLCNVTGAVPEFGENDELLRIPTLEHSITEAIYIIRNYQATYGSRLYWNRIIIHIRTPLNINLKQIDQYSLKLGPRFYGLGLETTTIYTHTVAKENEPEREIEFTFENMSGIQFSLRARKVSNKPIEPMNNYIAKTVNCRRRNMSYPYEIIKMLTRPGHSAGDKFPRGSFQEYDLQYNKEDRSYKTITVPERLNGENTSNIVFGVIINFSKSHPYGLKRVLIVGDPSGDMGSLAEDECRRVNAAIDLAQEKKLPVEWIPISSGARIDMSSGTENLDWTACTLRKIIEFTQQCGEINIIVAGTNVGAQSYWNAEATMLMHTSGLLIMTDSGSMLLTGKKALDFSGSVSAEDNMGIGGAEKIMAPNGEAQIWVDNLNEAYQVLFHHYDATYKAPGFVFPLKRETTDSVERNVCKFPYKDPLGQGFSTVGDIFSQKLNGERKKPFDMRQIMSAVVDQDFEHLERWQLMKDAETAIVWEARIGGYCVGLLGIESRPLSRVGPLANDGPETWTGGTLFPISSKKIARAINSYSNKVPLVILANLSGFDGSPESLRNCQLEYGAEIGRAVVNFKGPIIFVVTARYHGGAYVVFSRTLNPYLRVAAIEGTYASVIGGAPAAAVVFPKKIQKDTYADQRVVEAREKLSENKISSAEFNKIFQEVHAEKQSELAQNFDRTHSVERAQKVGSLHDIISAQKLRSYLAQSLQEMTEKYLAERDNI